LARQVESFPAAETRQIVLKEIGAKWGKFSEQDLSALKGKDDLVTQIVAKYSLEKNQVQRDVTRPGATSPDYVLARACAEKLVQAKSVAQ
jgi:hypothetical protein